MEIQKMKRLVKCIPVVRELAEINRRRKLTNKVLDLIDAYKKRYLKYSVSLRNSNDSDLIRRTIIVDSHIIEKGLSHTDYRAGFGKAVVIELQDCLKKYHDIEGYDVFAYKNGVSLLREYHELNERYEFDDSDYYSFFPQETEFPNNLAPYRVSSVGMKYNPEYEAFIKNRHSVRIYVKGALPISKETLHKVITLANNAPSACNRQATYVYAVTDKTKFKMIEMLQRGCKGFGENVSAFLFVVSDLSLYTVEEFKLPIFDAGIFTMNLLYALEAYGLYSCTLNASFNTVDTTKIHEIVEIPDSYEINGLVAVYNLPRDEDVLIAASPRRKGEDILTVLE